MNTQNWMANPAVWLGALALLWLLLTAMVEAGGGGLAVGLALAIAGGVTLTQLVPAANQLGWLKG